jgi:nicotinate-nucleotide pyrophosphorylase (carboxylating)
VTTDAVVDPEVVARARIVARQEGVFAGAEVAELAFRELDPGSKVTWRVPEGGALRRGLEVAAITGRARAVLSGERVALNFLQHLSGVATLARAFVKAVEGTGVSILDTRKTTPGLRFLEKHAVRVGGAQNHRFGLFDGVLIKENHIRAAGGLKQAMERLRKANPGLPVVVEAKSAAEALDVAALQPDRMLLDNFTPSAIADVLKRLHKDRPVRPAKDAAPARSRPEIEVSGGIRLANVRDFALPGVDYISIGAITHSAPALDLSLLVDEVAAG